MTLRGNLLGNMSCLISSKVRRVTDSTDCCSRRAEACNAMYSLYLVPATSLPLMPWFITLCHKLSEIVAQLEIYSDWVDDHKCLINSSLKFSDYETRKNKKSTWSAPQFCSVFSLLLLCCSIPFLLSLPYLPCRTIVLQCFLDMIWYFSVKVHQYVE